MAKYVNLTAEQKAVVFGYFRDEVYHDGRLPFKDQYRWMQRVAQEEDIPAEAILNARLYYSSLSRLPGSIFPLEQQRHIGVHHEVAASHLLRRLTHVPEVIERIDACISGIRLLDAFVTKFIDLYSDPQVGPQVLQHARQDFVGKIQDMGMPERKALEMVGVLDGMVRDALTHTPSPEEAVRIRTNSGAVGHAHGASASRVAVAPPALGLEDVRRRRMEYVENILALRPLAKAMEQFTPEGGYTRRERLVTMCPSLEPLLYSCAQGGNRKQHDVKEGHLGTLDGLWVGKATGAWTVQSGGDGDDKNTVRVVGDGARKPKGSAEIAGVFGVFMKVFDRALEVRGMTPQHRQEMGFVHGRIFSTQEHTEMVHALKRSGVVTGPVVGLKYIKAAETIAQVQLGMSLEAGQARR